MNKKHLLLAACLIAVANVASAATVNVPDGLVGLWLFPNGADGYPEQATIGNDVTFAYDPASIGEFGGPSVQIGTESSPFLYQDDNLVQVSAYASVDVTPGIGANGGGLKTNEYTWLIDYKQNATPAYASLFDTTDGDAHGAGNSDGDLFVKSDSVTGLATVGVTDTGYSTLTFDPKVPHRIVVSADLGDFFRVYIDGTLFLDSTTPAITDPSAIDGRFALPSTFHLLVDNGFEAEYGLLSTAMMWDHALTTAEVAGMGTFSDPSNNNFPTPLILSDPVPEPSTLALLGLGLSGILGLRRKK